jgi:class 3 adenylate cyclase
MRVTNNITYSFENSRGRIIDILNSDSEFEEVDSIPNSDRLTYTNGFNVNCYSIFIDIRDSSKLPDRYKRSTLAKIYRAFISEIVAIFQSSSNCREVNIVGDSVWGVFDYQKKDDVLQVFNVAASSNSLTNTLNYFLRKRNIQPITIGIGIDRGRALMVQAGFAGSGINDIIYMGGVVNMASKYCSKANKEVSSPLVISEGVWRDLEGFNNGPQNGNQFYQTFFNKHLDGYYFGDVIRIDMNVWLNQQA